MSAITVCGGMCNGFINGFPVPHNHISDAISRTSKEVKSGGKQIKMIRKQYHITEVAYSGEIWFDSDGRLVYQTRKNLELFKHKIVYEDDFNKEFVWCFN